MFYKYINRIQLIYHKQIKLQYLIAFILQYKANSTIKILYQLHYCKTKAIKYLSFISF